MSDPGAAGRSGVELARMLATLGWTLAATAATIAILGAMPGWIAGDGDAARRCADVQEAERRLGALVLVPGYFPGRLVWPPRTIRVAGGRRGSVLLEIAARGGGPKVELLQATRDGDPIAAELLAGRTVLRSSRTTVGAVPATIRDVLVDGRPAREIAWELRGRALVLRSAGELDELFRMARSVHREGGR